MIYIYIYISIANRNRRTTCSFITHSIIAESRNSFSHSVIFLCFRSNKYLQKSSISRVCAVGGFFISIPVFLTGKNKFGFYSSNFIHVKII